eukprot:3112494-Amphidinium_carterae.1
MIRCLLLPAFRTLSHNLLQDRTSVILALYKTTRQVPAAYVLRMYGVWALEPQNNISARPTADGATCAIQTLGQPLELLGLHRLQKSMLGTLKGPCLNLQQVACSRPNDNTLGSGPSSGATVHA